MTVTDRDRGRKEHVERARKWLQAWRYGQRAGDTDVGALAAEFAAVAAEAERRAFERTREAAEGAIRSVWPEMQRGDTQACYAAAGRAIRALTFEQVMGGEK